MSFVWLRFALFAFLMLGGLSPPVLALAPFSLYQQGLRLLQRGHSREALVYFQQAVRQEPFNVRFLFSQAVAHTQLQELPEAFQCYQRALAALPDPEMKPHIQAGLADIYFYTQAYDQAITLYEQVIFAAPHLKGVRFRLALTYFYLKQPDLARHQLQILLKQEPLLTEARYLSSLIQLTQSDYAQALQDLQTAQLPPSHENFIFQVQLNSVYVLNQDFERALKHALELVRYHARSYPSAYLVAGDVFFESLPDCLQNTPCFAESRIQAAMDFYQKYTLIEPEQALGHYKLARLYLWQKKPQSALTFARRADTLFAAYPDRQVLQMLSFLLDKGRRTAPLKQTSGVLSAEELEWHVMLHEAAFPSSFASASLSEPPEHQGRTRDKWLFYRGYLHYLHTGDPLSAEREWEKVLQYEPSGSRADLIRALRMLDARQFLWAEQFLRQAIRKSPDWWLPYRLLGNLWFEQGNFEAARFALDQSIRWNPLSREAFFRLIESCRHSQRAEAWLENLKYALVFFPDDSDFQRWYWRFLEQKTGF